MRKHSLHATGEVEISKEHFLKFISYASWIKQMKYEKEFIEYKKLRDGTYRFRLLADHDEEAIKCISLLNHLGNIKELRMETDALFNQDEGCYRVLGKNGVTQKYVGVVAQKKVPINDQASYTVFQNFILDSPLSHYASTHGIEGESFIEILTKSKTVEEMTHNLKEMLLLVNNKSLFDTDFETHFFVLTNSELEMYDLVVVCSYLASTDELSFEYKGEHTQFIDPQPFLLDARAYDDFEKMVNYPSWQDLEIEVSWDFLDDGEPMNTFLCEKYAKTLFTTLETGKIKKLYNGEWVSPCSICVNRLEKEINGCALCEFQPLQNEKTKGE